MVDEVQGVRYPTFAFQTGGVGQADEGIPPQPFETFCYDSALLQAKIENFNVVPYTSVLPKELYGNIKPLTDDIVKQLWPATVPAVMTTRLSPPVSASAGVKTKTANSSAAGLLNMLNILILSLMMKLQRLIAKCG